MLSRRTRPEQQVLWRARQMRKHFRELRTSFTPLCFGAFPRAPGMLPLYWALTFHSPPLRLEKAGGSDTCKCVRSECGVWQKRCCPMLGGSICSGYSALRVEAILWGGRFSSTQCPNISTQNHEIGKVPVGHREGAATMQSVAPGLRKQSDHTPDLGERRQTLQCARQLWRVALSECSSSCSLGV